MQEPTLKPCPFFGAELTDFQPDDGQGFGWAVHPRIENCFMSQWEFDAFDWKQWNRRAEPQE